MKNFNDNKHLSTYMRTAVNIAQDSHCQRLQVGCVFIKNNNIIGHGCNGTLPGRDNWCEIDENTTKPEVLHAEACAIGKMASLGINTSGSKVFVTTLPCQPCATLLATARVKSVYYLTEYRDNKGLDILKTCGIEVFKMSYDESSQQYNIIQEL